MTQAMIVADEQQALARLRPQSVKELAWFANQAAASGLFKVGNRNMTGGEAFLLMSQGVELGLSPLQSLRELYIINGRVDVPASVRAARISASPKTRVWEAVGDDKQCTITAKRIDRENGCVVTVTAEKLGTDWCNKHKDHLDDALYARAVRRISRQYFPDLNLGMESSEEYDPEKVIDVAAVQRITEHDNGVYGQHVNCGGNLYLRSNTTGGAYLECAKCGERSSPPQEVRDAIRGTPPELTVAAQELEPGEREMTDEEAVQYLNEFAPPEPSESAEDTPEPAAEVAVDAAPNAAGSYSARWRTAAQLRILGRIAEAREWTGTAKVEMRETLLDAGWNGLPGVGIDELVRDASDEKLAALLDKFGLKVDNIAKENA